MNQVGAVMAEQARPSRLRAPHSPWRRLLRNRAAIFGAVILLIIVTMALFPELFTDQDPFQQRLRERRLPPVWLDGGNPAHPLGTDNLGRDLFARIVYGARVSVQVGFISSLISAVVGTVLGLLAGYFRRRVDWVIQHVGDVQLALPFILLALFVIAVLGLNTTNLIMVFGLTNWTMYARPVRAAVLSLREQEYIQAAIAVGASTTRILFKHLLPNLIPTIIVVFVSSLGAVIVAESSLSFLGLGVQPPTPSWGRMLSEGRDHLTTAWWLATFPGLAITLTVVAVNWLGDGLRDALDPRLKLDL